MPKKRIANPKHHTLEGSAATRHPPVLQVAALCWRRSRKGLRVLLITSRDTGRWIIPKGWPMRHRTEAQAAAREAFEEAGLRGPIEERSIGYYTYTKKFGHGQSAACVVRLYPMEVHEMLKQYPETGQRRVKWFSPGGAARRVAEPELAACIRAFDPSRDDAPPPAEP